MQGYEHRGKQWGEATKGNKEGDIHRIVIRDLEPPIQMVLSEAEELQECVPLQVGWPLCKLYSRQYILLWWLFVSGTCASSS